MLDEAIPVMGGERSRLVRRETDLTVKTGFIPQSDELVVLPLNVVETFNLLAKVLDALGFELVLCHNDCWIWGNCWLCSCFRRRKK